MTRIRDRGVVAGDVDVDGPGGVLVGVEVDAEEAEPFGGGEPERGAMLADPGGEDDGVEAAHRGRERADRRADPRGVDLQGEQGAIVAPGRGLLDLPIIA